MAKSKKNKEQKETTLRIVDADAPVVEITAALIKDGFCNYTYLVRQGIGVGNIHNVKGRGLATKDLLDAMSKLNVHMACVDGAFKHAGIEVIDTSVMHGHEITTDYTVTGIKMRGSEDEPAVSLMGRKRAVQVSGEIELKTPKIDLDALSSYHHAPSLSWSIDTVLKEVMLYHEGKYTSVTDASSEDIEAGDINFEEAEIE